MSIKDCAWFMMGVKCGAGSEESTWEGLGMLEKFCVGLFVAVGVSAIVGGVWLLSALLACWFWKLGVVPFGVQPLTYWQAWGLIGLFLLVGGAHRNGAIKRK